MFLPRGFDGTAGDQASEYGLGSQLWIFLHRPSKHRAVSPWPLCFANVTWRNQLRESLCSSCPGQGSQPYAGEDPMGTALHRTCS